MREDDKLLLPSVERYCFSVPWFKHYDREWIERFAAAFRKVIEHHEQLLKNDTDKVQGGLWYGTAND